MKIIEVDGFEANHPYTRLDLPDFRRHLLTGTSAAGQCFGGGAPAMGV